MKSTAEKSSSSALLQRSQGSPFFSKRGEDSFFAASGVQTKIEVGEPGDPFEREADAMAEQVMQQSGAGPAAKQEEEKVQAKPLAESITPLVRRTPDEEQAGPETPQPEEAVQAKAEAAPAPPTVSPSVESQLHSNKGGGSPLPTKTREEMEGGFGTDFSGVRVHDGPEAIQMSRELGAQAFTHGQDIYFNQGKYQPENPDGKRLLAHELTHTVQQGGGVQRKLSAPLSKVQRAKGPEPDEVEKIKGIASISEGSIVVRGSAFEVLLTNFPLKQYANLVSPAASVGQPAPHIMPKPGTRKSKQAQIWKTEMAGPVKESLGKVVDESIKGESDLSLTLKNLGSSNPNKTQLIGNFDTLAKEIIVPFWGQGGHPIIHQIEHKIDWQVLGAEADKIENLILIDQGSNAELGNIVNKYIRDRIQKLLGHYRGQGIASLADRAELAMNEYTVKFESFTTEDTPTKSILSNSNLRPTSGNNPISNNNLEVKIAEIPAGHFIFKTATKGVGYVVPYNFSNDVIEIKGNAGTHTLESVTLKKVAKDNTGSLENATEAKTVGFKKERQDVYKMDNNGLASTVKNILRLKYLSPVVLNDDLDISPFTGLGVTGKVDTDIPILKDVPIEFVVQDSNFTVQATVSTDVLKDKLPKPLKVNYSSLTLGLSTQKGLFGTGEIGFGIDKVGNGYVGASVTATSFGLKGGFSFENAKLFKKAEISFEYTQKEWKIEGLLAVDKGKIKGIESAEVKIGYDGKTLTGNGTAKLAIPGIDTVTVSAVFEESGNFSITGDAKLTKVPGLKSGEAKVTLSKKGSDYELAMAGSAVPNLPNIPGLAASFTVSYDKGLFKVAGEANYKKGKIDGKLTVGVTNGVVDENGKITAGKEGGETTVIYGNGSLKINLLKDLTAELSAAVNQQGEVLIWGEINLDTSPFKKVEVDKSIFSISQNIPVAGVPFANVFVRIGAEGKFYFSWDPLNIKLKTTLEKATIEEIEKGKLAGDLMVGLYSQAKAGIKLTITAGVGVAVTVLAVSVNIGGSVGFGIAGKLGAEATAKWNTQKGLLIQSAEGILDVTPSALLELTGSIVVELDLLVDKIPLYTRELGSLSKKIDLSDYGLKVTVPMKFSEQGDLEGINYDKLTVQPPFDKAAGQGLLDRVMNPDKAAPPKLSKEEQAKQAIRATVSERMRAAKANSSEDLYAYSAKLRVNVQKKAPPELSTFVLQAVEDELRAIESEEFTAFRAEIFTTNESLDVKLKKVDAFAAQHGTVSKEDLDILRGELKDAFANFVGPVQPKLAPDASATPALPIGGPDDPHEREAEAVAERVMRQGEETMQAKPLAAGVTPLAQAKTQPRPAPPTVPPAVESGLQLAKGGGNLLPDHTRGEMEEKFGTDFAGVRVHTDAEAARMNLELGAQAFTHGNDVYFNDGKYQPESAEGKQLLAHELTHTVQQGAGVQRKVVQRNPPPAGGGTGGGSTFTGTHGELDISTIKKVKLPLLRIPRVKRRFTPTSFTIPRNTVERINQRQDWATKLAPFKPDIQAALDTKIIAENAPTDIVRNNVQMLYFKTRVGNEYVVGSKAQIVDRAVLPNWTMRGERHFFDVDHKLELQLGGENSLDNYWLLDASANRSSGARINNELNSKISSLLTEARPTLGTQSGFPANAQAVRDGQYEIRIEGIRDDLPLGGNSDPTKTWELAQIQQGRALQGLRALTMRQIISQGFLQQGAITRMSLMSSESGGRIHQVPVTEAEGQGGVVQKAVNIQMGRNFLITQINYDQAQGRGTFAGTAFRQQGGPATIVQPADMTIEITKSDAVAFGGYINQNSLTQAARSILRARGMSPIEMFDTGLDFEQGFNGRGVIRPTVPFLKSDLTLDLVIDRDGISVEKTFNSGELNVPSPFKINDCSLTVRAGTGGWALSGNVDFEIERVGRGTLTGGVRNREVFVRGNFEFDPGLFSRARVGVEYEQDRFKVEGDIGIDRGKVRGIKQADAHVEYREGTLTATGNAELDVKGLQRGTMSLRYTQNELTIGGTFQLSNEIPRLRSGEVAATVTKNEEGYSVAASGTAQPDIPGLDASISVNYDNGALTIEGSADYARGIARGRVRVGATNRTLDPATNTPSGPPGDRWIVYGEGELSLRLTPWLQATAGVRFSPTGELTVTGRIGLPGTVNVFDRKEFNKRLLNFPTVEIPLLAIPVGPRSVGLVATIGGGIDFSAGIGPGQLEELFGEVSYTVGQDDSLSLHGRGKFVIPADASVRIFGRLGIGLSIGIARVTGNVELGAAVGIRGAAEAEVDVNWDPRNGISLDAVGRIYVEPALRLDISLVAEAVLDLYFYEFRKEWRKTLAQREFGSGMRYGLEFPVHYQEGQPFDIALDDLRVIQPEIDIGTAARRFGRELFA